VPYSIGISKTEVWLNMTTLKEVSKKLYLGDPLTDSELITFLPIFINTEHCLRQLGPIFTLSANELARHIRNMKDWKEARKRNA
jgi:hypothetical protein